MAGNLYSDDFTSKMEMVKLFRDVASTGGDP